jgi:hypothetical protein
VVAVHLLAFWRLPFIRVDLGFILDQSRVQLLQCIGAQATYIVLVGCANQWILLQQVGNLAEDSRAYAIGAKVLEQQKSLKRGVGGEASTHSPMPAVAQCWWMGRNDGYEGF